LGVPVWSEQWLRGCLLGSFFVSENDFRAFTVNSAKWPKIGVQLTTIQRNAAWKALVADVKAENLDASSVDLLRIVKVRCRWCAPLSVLECPSIPRSTLVP
jgi:hypothetical protein